ncbi:MULTISPECIES: methyl-accepting chemotaxis protein [Rhizobium/Agrobacterium group]|uniref:methyl-accepting chemotaxis protein n=2 Tax=Rhizobiaceae TaxID=82115 RepID=UPI000B401DD0|nr:MULTISPECIES: methyl-accepting chemotaxis protein [Rhizobium/Agrobacterium group]MCF1482256.1 HAMP domain-containing protein [Allorhizobium ampelinum]NSZ41966.1 HAMP domain-containing protein [Agrobacterium vitis]NTA25675.1 HAMP domain-containing protein [Allorhizobium ampelinum]OVE96370.1 methyl-accepting chemotaxis protein [Allorhizobium ampelinum]
MAFGITRIGSKLSVMSGAGIVLVLIISVAGWLLSRAVDRAVTQGQVQSGIARNIIDMKASLRGMDIGVGELRLATSQQQQQAAVEYFQQRHSSAEKYLNLARADMRLPANQERARRIGELLTNYSAATTKLATDIGSSSADVSVSLPPLKKMNDELAALVDETVIAVKQKVEETNEERLHLQNTASAITLCLSVLLVTLMIGSALFGRRAIAAPIQRITDCMADLAKGDLSKTIPYASNKDEIGDMARAVLVFKQNAEKVRDLNAQEVALQAQNADLQSNISHVVSSAVAGDFSARIQKRYDNEDLNRFAASVNQLVTSVDLGVAETNRVVAALAEGDLTEAMRGEFKGVFLNLQTNMNATMESLRVVMTEVRGAIDMIKSGAGELRHASSDLSKRSEQQAASLEETAAALEEITSAVKSSTDRSGEAADMVAQARQSTEQSRDVVRNTVAAMERIEQASNEIGNIINVIDEIAFQTNLLALNAGVEAARAGEAGKGFAVVAQEVRELAQRSAGAAKDIKTLITRSRNEVADGVALVTETGDVLGTIGSHVVKINEHVHSIAQAAREQSTGLSEINTAINQMDQTTQQNAAMVEESTAATNKLADEASNLSTLVARFKVHTGTQASAPSRPISSHAAPSHSAMASAPAGRRPVSSSRGNTALAIEKDWEEF